MEEGAGRSEEGGWIGWCKEGDAVQEDGQEPWQLVNLWGLGAPARIGQSSFQLLHEEAAAGTSRCLMDSVRPSCAHVDIHVPSAFQPPCLS